MYKVIKITLLILAISTGVSAQSLINNGSYIGISKNTFVGLNSENTLDLFHNKSGSIISLSGSLKINALLTNDGAFNIEDGAELIDNGIIEGTGASQINVKKTVFKGISKLVSMPVSSGLSNVFSSCFVSTYVESSDSWQNLASSQALLTTTGYSVQPSNDNTLVFTGKPNCNSQDKNLTVSSKGWNLVGNPFTATIDWEDTENINITNTNPTAYYWTGVNYATYTRGGQSTNGGTRYIEPMKGFFVKAVQPSTMTINVNARMFNVTGTKDEIQQEGSFIKLRVSNGLFSDEMILSINPKSTGSYDNYYDATKLFSLNQSVPQIYSICSNGEPLVVNSIPEIDAQNVIPIGIINQSSDNLSLDISDLNIDTDCQIFIEDIKTNKIFSQFDLPYHFVSSKQDSEHRFNLYFASPATDLQDIKSDIVISTVNNDIYVRLPMIDGNAQIRVYDIMGRPLYTEKVYSNETMITIPIITGIYIVKVETALNSVTKRVLLINK